MFSSWQLKAGMWVLRAGSGICPHGSPAASKNWRTSTRVWNCAPHRRASAVRTVWHMILPFPFGSGSSLEAAISLDSGSHLLRYEVNCDWREFGSEKGIPDLNFHLPLGWKPVYLFDLPFGMKERLPSPQFPCFSPILPRKSALKAMSSPRTERSCASPFLLSTSRR